ncbi:MAG: anhydro-N-acetylmuramic acid kinase [Betaproteobacteria bacterium]
MPAEPRPSVPSADPATEAPAADSLFIGLMSGTSADGVDAVLLDTGSESPRTLGLTSLTFDGPLRQSIESLQRSGEDELARAALVANMLADVYAAAVDQLLTRTSRRAVQIRAIGAHGQTVRHQPGRGYSIQLLNAARLSELSGIAVVHDLRAADVAASGQGAPLVPAFHANVFSAAGYRRAIVNIGGIANVSLLPATAGAAKILGHDTGPGNTLLDLWYQRHCGGPFDAGGVEVIATRAFRRGSAEIRIRAQGGKKRCVDLPAGSPDAAWIDKATSQSGNRTRPRDVQATLAELTALTIADACRDSSDEVYLCGGGTFNDDLIGRLRRHLAGIRLEDTGALGIEPMAVEAAAFAWLAWRRVALEPGNLPAVTGARGPRVLGSVADPFGRLRDSTR